MLTFQLEGFGQSIWFDGRLLFEGIYTNGFFQILANPGSHKVKLKPDFRWGSQYTSQFRCTAGHSHFVYLDDRWEYTGKTGSGAFVLRQRGVKIAKEPSIAMSLAPMLLFHNRKWLNEKEGP